MAAVKFLLFVVLVCSAALTVSSIDADPSLPAPPAPVLPHSVDPNTPKESFLSKIPWPWSRKTTTTTTSTTESTTTPTTTPPSTTTSTTTPPPPPTTPPTSTTSSEPPTTSSEAPTTSSEAPPTSTTSAPPVDTLGTWSLKYPNSNTSCAIVQFAVQLEIPCPTVNGSSAAQLVRVVDLPADAKVDGACPNVTDVANKTLNVAFEVDLTWEGKAGTSKMSMVFLRVAESTKYRVNATTLDVTYAACRGNGTTRSVFYLAEPIFNTSSVDHSYKCAREQTFNLTNVEMFDNHTEEIAYMHVSRTRVQAFHNATDVDFATEEDCEPYVTPDAVPIAVGCALAVLVLIVLGAYLWSRRRAQAQGYLSM